MSQHDMNLADAAGAAFLADLNLALPALASNSSGATEPTTTYAYQLWADTTSGWLKQRNAANSDWILRWPLGTGAAVDIASATTLDLTSNSASSGIIRVTGTTPTTGITLADGQTRILRAAAAWPITHGASLICPGAASFTCPPGLVLLAIGEPAGVVRLEPLDPLGFIQSQTGIAYTTGGSSTAYTLTPSPAISANAENQEFDVEFHTAAGTTPTLAISGQTALNLKYRDRTGAKQAVTSTQVPSGWRSKVVNDGTDFIVREIPSVGVSKYTSTDQTITSGGLLTLAHGLGAAPFGVHMELVCQIGELGFSAGDVVSLGASSFIQDGASGTNAGVAVWIDATNVNVRIGSGVTPFAIQDKSTGSGSGGACTNANWKLRVKAWL